MRVRGWHKAMLAAALMIDGGCTPTPAGAGDSLGDSSTAAQTSTGQSADTPLSTTGGPETTGPACETWCGNEYPSAPGCDEDDDGIDPGGGESGGADNTDAGMGDDIPLATSIYDVQQGGVDAGTLVQLTDVIVTTPAATTANGVVVMFTVAEADGGPYSGITVRMPAGAVAAALKPGDLATIVGRRSERYIFSVLEVGADQLTVNGIAEPPAPVVIPAGEIGMLSVGSDIAASLESVVVQVLQPAVTDSSPCAGQIALQAGVQIDDRFLVANGEVLPTAPAQGYGSVTGPLLYTYNGFQIAPRTTADLAAPP